MRPVRRNRIQSGILVAGMLALAEVGYAQDVPEETSAKFQVTYVWQRKSPLGAPYSGPHSLSPDREKSYSFTGTAALGTRAWRGGELYFDPEVAQGVPLSGLTGLGGFTNGEIARTTGPSATFYRARLFARQTWGFGGGSEKMEPDANQLAGSVDRHRLVLTVGNLSVLDIFDDNAFCHDPRTQFLNWSLMTHGAYDYAADARGYSWGLTLEYLNDDWRLRAGRFIQPKEPNQLALDSRIFKHYGDQIEVERAYTLADRPGKFRFLVFRNVARMARYQDALDLAAQTGGAPDINAVRTVEQVKRGFGINLEQAISSGVGLFGRASWADGQTETYAFTEIDQSLSGGVSVKGGTFGRSQDTLGIAFVRNTLSAAHRNYLAAGGLGFFLGDGALNYRPESILEAYYSLNVAKDTWFSADFQRISNPGYNADRGPATVISARLHYGF
jgi:high affinity Mn2+ porin